MAMASLQLPALILAVLAVQVVSQSGTVTSCHADLLVKGINFAALSPQVQQQVGQAVAQKIALETGMAKGDVMTKMLAGNYNAPWSPSAGRPPADAFVASLVRECKSAEMMLGVFRGPQLQAAVVEALKGTLASANAVNGEISIIGASVVPEKMVTTTQAPPGQPVPQPSAALPSVGSPAAAPPSVATDATPQSGAGAGADSSGPGPGLLFIGVGVLLIAACGIPAILSRMKQAQQDDDDEESYNFTGH